MQNNDIEVMDKTPTLFMSQEEVELRKKVIYTFLKDMGINLQSSEHTTMQMIYSTRLIPVHLLMSGFVTRKIADGYSHRQITDRYPVTIRHIRTINEKLRWWKKNILDKVNS